MTRWGVLLLGALWTVAACQHAREVEDADAAATAEEKADATSERAAKKARKSRAADVKRPSGPGRPELSSNPAGLMKPEGPMRIQKKLADEGFYSGESTGQLDEKTMDALRKFQGKHDLAKTGQPDRETLKALGLDPADIWRRPAPDLDTERGS